MLTGLFLMAMSVSGQNYLSPEEGYKVAYFSPEQGMVQTFDVNLQYFYFDDGSDIYQVDPLEKTATDTFPRPADYIEGIYPGFLSISPDGLSLYAGYSNADNSDSRIYRIDVVSGEWILEARMPANWDMEFLNDSILVSGLNSAEFTTPNGIFVLDTTGADMHRKIIETGGSSAGLAVDAAGNLYYATSDLYGPNALYRWSSTDMQTVIEMVTATPLQLEDAEKLADLPNGAHDCEVDMAGNVIFTMNVWDGTQVLGQWNGTTGDGYNYDTLAVASDWLGMVKSRGNYSSPYLGNSVFTLGYGQPVADLHTFDYFPIQTRPLPVLTGYEGAGIEAIDLTEYFTDLDDPESMTFEVTAMSVESVATLVVDGDTLSGTYGSVGQSNLYVEGTSNGLTVSGDTKVACWPVDEGESLVADFEDLTLNPESYWNGSDGSGAFTTGEARFHNDYNAEYFSWSGWSYSNTSDVSTPGWFNQYSAITGGGMGESGSNFGISSLFGPAVIDFPEKAYAPKGFYVTNATYAALSMEQGDAFGKKFGGADGSDPDYFMLSAWGYANGESTDTVDYYLADYRSDVPEEDYIIETWQWVDLSSFGKVDSLKFDLASSDNNDWGMVTPAYFCMDDLYLAPDAAPYVANPIPDMTMVTDGIERVIDLSEVFSDPDDDDALIIKALLSDHSDPAIQVSISGDELTLVGYGITKATLEEIEVMVEGSLGGLSAVDTFVVSVEIIGGVNNMAVPELNLYPNPSDGHFVVGFSTGEELEVSVYSLTGTELYSQDAFMPGGSIDLSAQPAGAYILRVRYSGGVISKMIQKQ